MGPSAVYFNSLADPRVKSSVFMVAGTPIEEIIATSELDIVKNIRKKHIGFDSEAEFLKALKKRRLPRLENIHDRRPSDFFLVISKKDRYVPTSTQYNLLKTLGHPKYYTSHFGHMGAPLKFTLFKKDRILKFYKKTWS